MKILLTVHDNNIASRFDQATEILIAEHDGHRLLDLRTIILPHRSIEDLSDLIVKEGLIVWPAVALKKITTDYLHGKKHCF